MTADSNNVPTVIRWYNQSQMHHWVMWERDFELHVRNLLYKIVNKQQGTASRIDICNQQRLEYAYEGVELIAARLPTFVSLVKPCSCCTADVES